VVESSEARRWDFTHHVITHASGIAWTSFNCSLPPLFPHLPPGLKFLSKTFQVVPIVKNPLAEISLQEAQRIKPEAKVGEALQVDLPVKADLPTEILRARKDLFDLFKVKKGDIKVRFENLTIEATARPKVGKVLEGLATYPTPPPVPHRISLSVAGFTVYLDSLFISPTTATARAELEFPPSIIDGSACRPGRVRLGNITLSSACQFHAEFPDSTFGPWTIDNTGLIISGQGFIADFSATWKWPGWTGPPPLLPSWRGVILLSGATTPGSSGTIVSNTGYLKAPYAFTNGLVTGLGLAANFTLTAPFAFKALQPFGYDLSLTAGTLRVQDSHISGGNFLNGDLFLPELAVIDQTGSRIKAHYDSLHVQDDLDLYGRVKIEQPLFWGEFTKTTPGLRAYAVGVPTEGHFYLSGTYKAPFYPLDASGFKEPSVFLLPISAHLEAENLQGVTVWGFPGFIIFTPDTPGPTPIGFGPGTLGRSWLHVASRGVHGSIAIYEYPNTPLKLGPTYQPFYVGKVPFSTNLVRVLQK